MRQMTFAVSPEVKIGRPLASIDHKTVLASSLRGPIEALWTPSSALVSCSDDHALLSALQTAFYEHYPLRLSPDVIWLTLARGFALHVNLNAEDLRHRFVRHSGQERLVVERPDFLPGRNNPWPEVFEAFSEQIAERVGKLRDFVRCDFSTTGATERAASELMVMDTFKAYFEYALCAGCGIPEITLTGTVADWKSIRDRAALFGEFGLEAWTKALDPVLAQFVAAAEGRAEPGFWRSLFRYNSGSGPSVMTGWVTVLFPYLKDDESEALYLNPYLGDWERRLEIDDKQHWRERRNDPQGVGMSAVPACVTSVPLKVSWGIEQRAMRLVGGLMGVSQSPENLALQPEWRLGYRLRRWARADYLMPVDWWPAMGFEFSTPKPDDLWSAHDESLADHDQALGRIAHLLATKGETIPPLAVRLAEIRQLRGLSQSELAERAGVPQANLLPENQDDMTYGTLQKVVTALGASLSVVARFPDGTDYELRV